MHCEISIKQTDAIKRDGVTVPIESTSTFTFGIPIRNYAASVETVLQFIAVHLVETLKFNAEDMQQKADAALKQIAEHAEQKKLEASAQPSAEYEKPENEAPIATKDGTVGNTGSTPSGVDTNQAPQDSGNPVSAGDTGTPGPAKQ